jgi:hypothetical protein
MPYKQVFTEELPRWLREQITDPLLETLAPTTKTVPEAVTRALPLMGEAWAVDDIKQEMSEGNLGNAALMGGLSLLPLGGYLARVAKGASVPKRFKQSGELMRLEHPEYARAQRILDPETPGYLELWNRDPLKKTPGKRYAEIYPHEEAEEPISGLVKVISGRTPRTTAKGTRPSQFLLRSMPGEEEINYLPPHFTESLGDAAAMGEVPYNLVSHARGTMLPDKRFLLEEAQSDWWRDVQQLKSKYGLDIERPSGAQKAWPRELMDELSGYVKQQGGLSILVPDPMIKYATNYGHLEKPPFEHELAQGALRLYRDQLLKNRPHNQVTLRGLPWSTEVKGMLGDELPFREIPLE